MSGTLSAGNRDQLPTVSMMSDDDHPVDLQPSRRKQYTSEKCLGDVSVDGSAGVSNRHVTNTNKGLNKLKSANEFLQNQPIVSCACWNVAGWHYRSSSFRTNAVNAKSMHKMGGSPKVALQRFLLQYRRTPLPSGYSPSELLQGRQICSKLDALFPSPAHVAQGRQAREAIREQLQEKARLISKVIYLPVCCRSSLLCTLVWA